MKKIPHSCKSRFCSSCGKAQTDIWISNAINTLPNVLYQHITFTMPSEYWLIFRLNRFLINEIPKIAAQIVLNICKKGKGRKHYLPGIFLVIHSFGRDTKFNVHIHLSLTVGGFRINKNGKVLEKYVNGSTIDHQIIKSMWKYEITNLFRKTFKAGKLIPYPSVKKHFKNLTTFNKWLDSHYQKTWNVFLQKTKKGAELTANYLGRYLKRPPLAETRILSYDGNNVTFEFKDHYTNSTLTRTLSVVDFIKTLICHIPDKFFKMVRYYGFLSNRVRTKYLKLFPKDNNSRNSTPPSYLKRFLKAFHHNPLKCKCGSYFNFLGISFACSIKILILRHNKKASSFAIP